jgi:hypothetical protein
MAQGFTETRCEICGEQFAAKAQVAEMYDPNTDAQSLIVHAECGLARGFEVA